MDGYIGQPIRNRSDMNYLIKPATGEPFFTNWWSFENTYNEGDIVFDLYAEKYTTDGINWRTISGDHL